MTMTSTSKTWNSLPTEMRLAIIENLGQEDLKAFSQLDHRTHQDCVPSSFKTVKLNCFEALQRFLDSVPRAYYSYIQELDLSTVDHENTHHDSTPLRTRTDAVITLLSACYRLNNLSLRMAGSLDKSIIAPFPFLTNLRQLALINCGDEETAPLSERLVVSIAASVPNLQELKLDRISRSQMHAPELRGVFPCVPLVLGDDDIPAHAKLGAELCLPSLLQIPTLRTLTIRDTHLGDARWTTTPIACRLQVLDLGSCYHENEDFNRLCTERIMAAVGPTVDEFSLTTAVSDAQFAKPAATPLQSLRKLHITPFFPVDSVVDTMSNLAGSPIERVSLQCYEDDVVDMCTALSDFLHLRVSRGPQFYDKLKRIDVSVTAAAEQCAPPSQEETEERMEAAGRLQKICRELRLASVIGKFPSLPLGPPRSAPTIMFADGKRVMVKARSNTI